MKIKRPRFPLANINTHQYAAAPPLLLADWSSIMNAVTVEEAVAMIPAGTTVMVGGFMGVGTPGVCSTKWCGSARPGCR
jgi:hypothetical protein